MMNNCRECGLEAQRGARFCRQCGSPLFVENEATMASTRQQFADPAAQYPARPSGPQSEDDAVDTARFYRPPGAPAPAPAYVVPTPQGTTASFWVLMSLVCALAVIGLVGAVVVSTRIQSRGLGEVISERVERQIEREAERAARNAEQMAARAEEAARRAAIPPVPPSSAPVPPVPPIPPGSQSIKLDDLIYPGAVIENKVLAAGHQNEQILMATSDSAADVRKFYEMRLGQPTNAQPNNARAVTRLIFTSADGATNTVVKVSPHPKLKGQREIELVRSSLK